MADWLIPFIVLILGLLVWEIISKGRGWKSSILFLIVGIIVFSLTVIIDQEVQSIDTEVWSGKVVDWNHEEEWDEYHPPLTTCTTDSKGNQSCTTTPGYWEHHPAENAIKTTDAGWVYVDKLPNGKEMDDSYPNKKSELKKYWPYGTPTASVHTYKNKVQASYSIFRHKGIDLKDYPDLPEYPDKVHNDMFINRIVGYVPNKKTAVKELDKWNTELNKPVPDPHNKKKMKSWKEVNLIFVNVGANKPEEYGFALQDKWEGGNKNDFVVAFSMNKDGKINWVYPFSWSEVDLLKLEVKDYMMGLGKVKDFKPVVDHVSKEVAEKFVRKQFADFNYLHIDMSLTAKIVLWIVVFGLLSIRGFFYYNSRIEEF